MPKEISDRIGVWQRNKNAGFFAASVYSTEMSLRDLYFEIDTETGAYAVTLIGISDAPKRDRSGVSKIGYSNENTKKLKFF